MFGQKQSILVEIEYILKSQAAEAEMDRLARKAGFGGVTSGGRIKDAQGRFVNKKEAMEKIGQVKLAEVKDKAQKKQMKGAYGLLGAMFLMAAVSGAIFSALQGAADAVGIFEILGAILLFLFLPAMLALLPIFIALLRFILGIPAPIREFIGLTLIFFALMLVVLGGFISFILMIAGIVSAFGASIPLGTILTTIAAVGALMVALSVLAGVAFQYAEKINQLANTNPSAAANMVVTDIASLGNAAASGSIGGPLGALGYILGDVLAKVAMGSSSSSSNSTTNIYNPRESNQPVTYNTAGG